MFFLDVYFSYSKMGSFVIGLAVYFIKADHFLLHMQVPVLCRWKVPLSLVQISPHVHTGCQRLLLPGGTRQRLTGLLSPHHNQTNTTKELSSCLYLSVFNFICEYWWTLVQKCVMADNKNSCSEQLCSWPQYNLVSFFSTVGNRTVGRSYKRQFVIFVFYRIFRISKSLWNHKMHFKK